MENPKKNYELIKKIGSGAYGKVYKARYKPDQKIVAIKVIEIDWFKKSEVEGVLNEIRILSSIQSQYVV